MEDKYMGHSQTITAYAVITIGEIVTKPLHKYYTDIFPKTTVELR